jgi:hypothetical protein
MRKAAPFSFLMLLCLVFTLSAQTSPQIRGHVRNAQGQPIAGAKLTWVEGQITFETRADGSFEMPPSGVRPQVGRVRGMSFSPSAQGLRFQFDRPGLRHFDAFAIDGRSVFTAATTTQAGELDLQSLAMTSASSYAGSFSALYLRVSSREATQWLRLTRVTSGWQSTPFRAEALPKSLAKSSALAKASARSSDAGLARLTFDITAAGYAPRRLAFMTDTAILITLLPAQATLKQRIALMMGDKGGKGGDSLGISLGLKLSWLEPTADGANVLYFADMADLDSTAGSAGATVSPSAWKAKSFTDSKGATLPSFSPDGRLIAYETGREAATLATSRIYLQAVDGLRSEGPAYPATNPRFFHRRAASAATTDTTLLIWCTSGRGSGYYDTTSRTLARVIVNGVLRPAEETLPMAVGSYNAGLSVDGKYFAAGFPRGIMVDRMVAGTAGGATSRRYMHVYPGSALGQDSLQVCNASISQDPAHPDRMLFIDFGVFTAPGYANLVRPATYAQHRMLLLADYTSEAPGRIVDFIDTPKDALAENKSWEDPEWSTHADFAIATTRLDTGDDITQPDVYLIRLSTHETVKLFSGANFYMPVAWVGTSMAF